MIAWVYVPWKHFPFYKALLFLGDCTLHTWQKRVDVSFGGSWKKKKQPVLTNDCHVGPCKQQWVSSGVEHTQTG